MLRFLCVMALLLSLSGCSDDDKPAAQVLDDVTRGAFLRTLEIRNNVFAIDDLNSTFSIEIQEQDIENGGLMKGVNVLVQFIDNTIDEIDLTTQAILLETIPADAFSLGDFELPVTDIEYSFAELLEATDLDQSEVSCKDQFIILLDLVLNDERVFGNNNAAACILAYDSFFRSPFLYTITVVEPIEDVLFTGTYTYESIVDGFNGPTFGPPILVQVEYGGRKNVRTVKFDNFPGRLPRPYYFTIACDELIFEKYQIRYNTTNLSCGPTGQPILLGPDSENAPINPIDDSVFEIWFVEGYEGFDGGLNIGTVPSRLRFTKE